MLIAEERTAVQVQISKALAIDLAAQIIVPATIMSNSDVEISAEVAGRILWVAKAGAKVKKGDELVKINSRLYEIAVKKSTAELARLNADLNFRNLEMKRIKKLVKQKNSAVRFLEQISSTIRMLEQEVIVKQSELEKAQYNLSNTTVKAPFKGIVVKRLSQMGNYVTVGDSILRLVDTQDTEIRTQVAMRVLKHLKVGLRVVIVADSVAYSGSIRTIIPVGNITSRMIDVRIVFEDIVWPIGKAVKVKLPVRRKDNSVVVSRDSAILRNSSTYLFKLDSQNKAIKVPIVIGASKGDKIEVTGNVKAGDRIVIRGGERLNDGQTVVVGGTSE